jgi:S-adenosylmethionine-diacylglycerol 3-amino-3-carboxypropyl transferase
MAPYWRQHARRLQRNLYAEGMTGRMLRAARRELGLDADWLREMARHAPEAREAHLRALLRGVQEHPVVRAALASPVQLLALGVNFTQRDRIVRTHQTHLADYFVEHLVGVLRGFDVETNWFLWYGAAGHFNHDRPDAVPPYLRPEPHAAAVEAPTQISYHHRDLFGVLDEAGPGTWSHFTLLDAVDWMPTPAQRRLFLALRRTARPGARVLWRSVEDEDLVEKLDLPFLRRLPGTEGAAARDRSNQYRRVHVYEIEA